MSIRDNRLLKWFALATGAIAALFLLFVLWLYAWLVPNLDNLRPRIAAYLSEQLHTRVEIDRIEAHSTMVVPDLTLSGVRLMGPRAEVLLSTRTVQVQLGFIQLLRGRWKSLRIEDIALDVEHLPNNVWKVAGIEIRRSPTSQNPALDWLLRQPQLHIHHATLTFSDRTGAALGKALEGQWHATDVLLGSAWDRLSLRLRLGSAPLGAVPLEVALHAKTSHAPGSHPSEWHRWRDVVLELQSPGLELARLNWRHPALASILPPALGSVALEGQVQTLRVVARPVQLSLASGVHGARLQTQLVAKALRVQGMPWTQARELQAQTLHHTSTLTWSKPGGWTLVDSQTRLDNPDLRSQTQIAWGRAEGLALTSELQDVNLRNLDRYLPLQVPAEVRNYLRSAILEGHAPRVRIALQGKTAAWKTFRIEAAVDGVRYDLAPSAQVAYPLLSEGKAHLTLDLQNPKAQLHIRDIAAKVQQVPVTGELTIADLTQGVLRAQLRSQTDFAHWLQLLDSPLARSWTGERVQGGVGGGRVHAKADLTMAFAEAAQQTQQALWSIHGELHLSDVSLTHFAPTATVTLPAITQLNGRVRFSEHGVEAVQARANVLDAPMHISVKERNLVEISAQLDAQGLRSWVTDQPRAPEFAAKLAHSLQGRTNYALRFHAQNLSTEVTTTLEGLQLELPAPLNKPAHTQLPLRITRHGSEVHLALGSSSTAQVRLSNTAESVHLHLDAPQLHTREWMQWLAAAPPRQPSGFAAQRPPVANTTAAHGETDTAHPPLSFLSALPAMQGRPLRLTVLLGTLNLQGRAFNNLVIGAQMDAQQSLIDASVHSDHINGYLQYLTPSQRHPRGYLEAMLTRLEIPESADRQALDRALRSEGSLSYLPSAHVRVQGLQFVGRKLGELELIATNGLAPASSFASAQRSEWKIEKLTLHNPDMKFDGKGSWSAPPSASTDAQRTMHMELSLVSDDTGALLKRLGVADALRETPLEMRGHVQWQGSPLDVDYPSLNGQIELHARRGQFLKLDPGAGRLLSILSLQALPKLLTLDWREAFSEGFTFERIEGSTRMEGGVMRTENLRIKSTIATVEIRGSTNVAQGTQDVRVLVLPNVNFGGASVLATTVNPLLGIGSFLVQLLLRKPILTASKREYHITGTWEKPLVQQVEISQTNPTSASAAPAGAGTLAP